jgi:hypothetical protein
MPRTARACPAFEEARRQWDGLSRLTERDPRHAGR